MKPAPSSLRDWLQKLKPKDRELALSKLDAEQLEWVAKDWKTWGRPEQQMPGPLVMAPNGKPWLSWGLMCGRGWGKTRTGAEAIREVVDAKRARNIALIGATSSDVRDTMIEGTPEFPALLGIWPDNKKPLYIPSKRLVIFHTGARAKTFSAETPDRQRGPQFDFAWGDEPSVWKYPEETMSNLDFGLRHGEARSIFTMTPKRTPLIKSWLKNPEFIWTRGHTYDNKANLSAKFLEKMKKYEGTRLGRQELAGELLEDVAGALWTLKVIEASRMKAADQPDYVRVLIGVDPSVAGRDKADAVRQGDECGIIAMGRSAGGRHCVLGDHSLGASPEVWAREVVKAYWRYKADVVVAEANNGGEMVRMTIQGVDPRVNVVLVHATRGKYTRAEPCAAAYERGDVSHVGMFNELEEEMTGWVPDGKQQSPNRLDALVWAWTYDAEGYGSPDVFFA